jgi:hypothetical protein
VGGVLRTTPVVLLLVGVALAGWLPVGRHLPLSTAMEPRPTGVAGRSPGNPLTLADMGGIEEPLSRIRTFSDVIALKFMTDEEITVLRVQGASGASVAVSTLPEGKATAMTALTRSPAAAANAVGELDRLQFAYNFERFEGPGSAVKATLLPGRSGAPTIMRALYAHSEVVFRLELRGEDEIALKSRFEQLLTSQLNVLSADA